MQIRHVLNLPASESAGRRPGNTTHQVVTWGLAAAGRHPQPSRFSLDRNTVRRVGGSAGAAEGPPPGKAAAVPLKKCRLWMLHGHGTIDGMQA